MWHFALYHLDSRHIPSVSNLLPFHLIDRELISESSSVIILSTGTISYEPKILLYWKMHVMCNFTCHIAHVWVIQIGYLWYVMPKSNPERRLITEPWLCA